MPDYPAISVSSATKRTTPTTNYEEEPDHTRATREAGKSSASPELVTIYFGCAGMRTARPRRPRTERSSQKHDFPDGQDQCRKCGMQRSVYEDTHAHCPGKQYTIKDASSIQRR